VDRHLFGTRELEKLTSFAFWSFVVPSVAAIARSAGLSQFLLPSGSAKNRKPAMRKNAAVKKAQQPALRNHLAIRLVLAINKSASQRLNIAAISLWRFIILPLPRGRTLPNPRPQQPHSTLITRTLQTTSIIAPASNQHLRQFTN